MVIFDVSEFFGDFWEEIQIPSIFNDLLKGLPSRCHHSPGAFRETFQRCSLSSHSTTVPRLPLRSGRTFDATCHASHFGNPGRDGCFQK